MVSYHPYACYTSIWRQTDPAEFVAAALTCHVIATIVLLDVHTTTFSRTLLRRILNYSVTSVILNAVCTLVVFCAGLAHVEWYIVCCAY
jgi:hypothetical protein